MNRSKTRINYRTLNGILEETIEDIFDPNSLLKNLHVYTKGISELRSQFLEPIIKQIIYKLAPIKAYIVK